MIASSDVATHWILPLGGGGNICRCRKIVGGRNLSSSRIVGGICHHRRIVLLGGKNLSSSQDYWVGGAEKRAVVELQMIKS